jgi:uncharacterized membrane protein YcaP (DUF421 family)
MGGVTWFELSVLAGKTFVVMLFLLVLYRLIGKRDLGQFNAYDLVTIMAVANAVQNAMTEGRGQLVAGFVCAGTLILSSYVLTRLVLKAPGHQKVLLGNPVVLLTEGKLVEQAMHRERVSRDEIKTALRQHGLYSIRQAALIVLEVDGSLSVIPKDQTNSSLFV